MRHNVGFVCGQAIGYIDATGHALAESLLAEIPTADLAGVRRGYEDVRARLPRRTPCRDEWQAFQQAVAS